MDHQIVYRISRLREAEHISDLIMTWEMDLDDKDVTVIIKANVCYSEAAEIWEVLRILPVHLENKHYLDAAVDLKKMQDKIRAIEVKIASLFKEYEQAVAAAEAGEGLTPSLSDFQHAVSVQKMLRNQMRLEKRLFRQNIFEA